MGTQQLQDPRSSAWFSAITLGYPRPSYLPRTSLGIGEMLANTPLGEPNLVALLTYLWDFHKCLVKDLVTWVYCPHKGSVKGAQTGVYSS